MLYNVSCCTKLMETKLLFECCSFCICFACSLDLFFAIALACLSGDFAAETRDLVR